MTDALFRLNHEKHFNCPYCNKIYNLTRLINANRVKGALSIFHCIKWTKNEDELKGCGKEFVLNLKPIHTYEIDIRKLVEEEIDL